MHDENDELKHYQDALRRDGADPLPLAALARGVALAPASSFQAAEDAFHLAANQQVSVGDSDYGALLLESLADACVDPGRRAQLYAAAEARARMFASWATAGGEGLARMIDVDRILAKRRAS